MTRRLCRMCHSPLPAGYLLHFGNMPKAAQFLPDSAHLSQDAGIDLDIFQCTSCGLVQTADAPVPYYREVVRAAAFSDEMQSFRREQFRAFADRYRLHGKRLVEIGCGRGEYLSLFREVGINALGLEHAEESVRYCNEQGMPVICDFIDRPDQQVSGAPFDAFAVLNFLEHWPDPAACLRGIANNLAPGAVGLVEVPNFDMILQKNLFTEFISDHLCYFTRETLTTLLQLNGFEVLECTAVWYGYILSAVVRKRAPADVSDFDGTRRHLQAQLDTFITQHAQHGVAIWGAGHQALAAIALLGLAGKVRYVVDSAPFKQGKFTAASHIPITAPETLETDPVDAIIIMAASYSDEVANTVRVRWGTTFALAILRDHGLEIL